MNVSIVLLAVGVLCALWDQLFGVRHWQGNMGTWSERLLHAWKERRWTIVGSILVLGSIVVELICG